MSLLKWAIFGLLMLPFVEIAVFIAVALKLGVLAALALTVLTSLAGMAVIRNAGTSDVQRVRTAFGARTISRTQLDGQGFLTVLGGFLLLLSGFVTDLLGLLLLLPLTQHAIGADDNEVTLFDNAGAHPLPRGSKDQVARQLIDHIAKLYHAGK